MEYILEESKVSILRCHYFAGYKTFQDKILALEKGTDGLVIKTKIDANSIEIYMLKNTEIGKENLIQAHGEIYIELIQEYSGDPLNVINVNGDITIEEIKDGNWLLRGSKAYLYRIFLKIKKGGLDKAQGQRLGTDDIIEDNIMYPSKIGASKRPQYITATDFLDLEHAFIKTSGKCQIHCGVGFATIHTSIPLQCIINLKTLEVVDSNREFIFSTEYAGAGVLKSGEKITIDSIGSLIIPPKQEYQVSYVEETNPDLKV